MNRRKIIRLLLEIDIAIRYFEKRQEDAIWSNTFGIGLEIPEIRDTNEHNIVIYGMCIDRLNERFTKQLNKLK